MPTLVQQAYRGSHTIVHWAVTCHLQIHDSRDTVVGNDYYNVAATYTCRDVQMFVLMCH